MRIIRGSDPGPVTKYGDYKPYLQLLFRSRCAYCISHEEKLGGYDAMEVDHFRPWGRTEFKHLKKEWANLYYACRGCNLHKSNHWPTTDQESRGLRFIDPCNEDPDDHIRLTRHLKTGELSWLRPLTPVGRYTIDKIRLNRKQLVDIRRELARRESEERTSLDRNREQIERLTNDVEERGSTSDVEAVLCSLRDEQRRILSRIEELRSRRPFLIEEL
jgi:hypothetical protein